MISPLTPQRDGKLTRELLLEPSNYGLGKVPARLKPDATTSVICGYCSTGCSLNVHLKDGKAINLTPDPDYPVNLGMACPKGWEALAPLRAADRATRPLLRQSDKNMKPVDWDTAMQTFCSRFKQIQAEHGKASVAFLSTGQIVCEEMALLGALAKFGMGIVHGDGNTRQCMATAATAYKKSYGFDAPGFTYEDFEESDVIVLVGANLCVAHPIMWERVKKNPHHPTIVVLDPRTTETAMQATRHLALNPKSDLTLLYGLARRLIELGAVDTAFVNAHTTGFADFAEHLIDYPLGRAAEASGIPLEDLEWLATILAQGKRVSFWWTMGVNQSHEGVRVAQAIINLSLMTGNIGRPGTGANSVTGQCNAMGSRLFSNTTNLMGGYDFNSLTDREHVARVLDIPVACIPDQDSWAYDQIMDGIDRGEIKGLWVIATNPAHSWIHQHGAHSFLKKLDFLVVQDMYADTETAVLADLFLPAAAWGEKEGCFINSERRLGLVKKIAPSPGQALSDFNIFRLIAEYWGCGELLAEWESPEAVFSILKRLSKGQPCDITGIRDFRMIDESAGVQWPLAEGQRLDCHQRRLFTDGRFFHPDGRARFCFESTRPCAERPDTEYPFWLLTGRGSSSQWHTQTRTGRSAVLRKLYPAEIYVELNLVDAKYLGIVNGQRVVVRSRRGRLVAHAVCTPTVPTGQVFIPMHYAVTNRLTYPEVDPYSRQPSYKAGAVIVEPAQHDESVTMHQV